MERPLDTTQTRNLPWWTWIAPLFLIEAGDQLSLLFKYSDAFSAFYLPTSVAFLLVHWWGPVRVLPAMFIIGTLNSWYYGTQNLLLWPLFGTIETFSVFLSWFLFSLKMNGKPWLPDIKQTILFLSLGLIVPILFEVTWWEVAYILDHTFPATMYWERFSRDLLSELIVNFTFALPALYFLTPRMSSAKLLLKPFSNIGLALLPKKSLLEIILIFGIQFALTFILPFENFWFVYGIFALYFAIRFGFPMALIGNAYLFFISYLLPALVENATYKEFFMLDNNITNAFLGSLLLYLFATVTGRVISDLRDIEEKLSIQNLELKETNQELDRFVYSVSHDLSAPLKSILGLVSISKLSDDLNDHKIYFKKIEDSVLKLNVFIKEVLDYSYNKRFTISIETIRLKELCDEILENLKYMESYSDLKVDFSGMTQNEIQNDRTRVKIILNNLLTNAMKYQKQIPGHHPMIKISSKRKGNATIIDVEDNGEGMRPEVKERIFNMFFRGHENSVGSGLGLYIAKEAAEKIEGRISVKSEYGKGSVFSVELKDLQLN